MQRVRSASPRNPGVSKNGERRTGAAGGFLEITHGPGGCGFEAQWRRHNACDTWEWLVPPKKSQLPPKLMGGEGAENGAGGAGERGADPTIRRVMGRGIGTRWKFFLASGIASRLQGRTEISTTRLKSRILISNLKDNMKVIMHHNMWMIDDE